jgi:two-component system, response regulator YesN
MYRALVVDDEAWIRRGIIAKIRRHGFPFSWVGESSDGSEALAMIRAEPADVVFVDVKMAPMDGLELMKTVRAANKNVKFIVITGYPEFDFAEQALNCGASGYLLKPIRNEEFVKLLQHVIIQLDQEAGPRVTDPRAAPDRHASRDRAGQAEVEVALRAAMHPLDTHQLTGPGARPVEEAGAGERFGLAVVHVDGVNYRSGPGHVGAAGSIRSFIRPRIPAELNGSRVFVVEDEAAPSNLFIVVVDANEAGAEGTLRRVSALTVGRARSMGFSVSIGTSDVGPTLSRALYLQARESLASRLLRGSGRVYRYAELGKSGAASRYDESLELLRGCIRLRHHEVVERTILGLLSPETAAAGDVSYLRCAYQSILAAVVSAFADLGIPATILDEAFFSESVYDYFDSAPSLGKHLASAVRLALDASVTPVLPHGEAVEEVRQYIQRNYRSRLSTRSLAARFGLHPNYLSSLFAQKTGCTVTRFVRETRINAACRLLAETSMSVAEVGELVGFDDPGYFHRVFRAVKGVTPQRMRDV